MRNAGSVFALWLLVVMTAFGVPACSKRSYEVTHSMQGEGVVTCTPEAGRVPAGAKIAFSAKPSSGWLFSHWEGDLTGDLAVVEQVVDRPINARAVFVPGFLDPNLERYVRRSLESQYTRYTTHVKSIEALTLREVESLEALYSDVLWVNVRDGPPRDSEKVRDLAGLELAKNLAEISLPRNAISDISVLRGLRRLRNIRLADNLISDISSLEGLAELCALDLDGNQITDISVLGRLPNLYDIKLARNDVCDIRPLAACARLRYLDLSENAVSDLSPMSGLRLQEVSLSGNSIVDISPLDSMELGLLKLARNRLDQTAALKVLGNMISLNILDLENTGLKDITPLSALKTVWRLWLGDNGISDLEPLRNLGFIHDLDLSRNPLASVEPLLDIRCLRWVRVVGIELEDPQELVRLEDRGVTVCTDGTKPPPDELP